MVTLSVAVPRHQQVLIQQCLLNLQKASLLRYHSAIATAKMGVDSIKKIFDLLSDHIKFFNGILIIEFLQ